MRTPGITVLLLTAIQVPALLGQRPLPTDAQVDAVLAVLPESARDGAHLFVRSADGLEALRPGSNEWRCWVERIGDRMGGNCHHAALAPFIERKRALSADPVNGEAPHETLAREVRSGRLSVPPASMEITAYGPMDQAGVPILRSRRFFLYFPFATAEDLGVPDVAPDGGGPWLHEAGTAEAHIMWSRPIEEPGR